MVREAGGATGGAELIAILSSNVQAAQAELAATRSATAAGRLLRLLAQAQASKLAHGVATWRQAALRLAHDDQSVALVREVTTLRSHCANRDMTITQLREQVAEARGASETLVSELEAERLSLQTALSRTSAELVHQRREGFRAATETRHVELMFERRRVLVLERPFATRARECMRRALGDWAASTRADSTEVAAERDRLAEGNAELSAQFHLLKRRLDAALAEKGRLQAEAQARAPREPSRGRPRRVTAW